jgi:hypothetical protein
MPGQHGSLLLAEFAKPHTLYAAIKYKKGVTFRGKNRQIKGQREAGRPDAAGRHYGSLHPSITDIVCHWFPPADSACGQR